jgi:hypothetical protein
MIENIGKAIALVFFTAVGGSLAVLAVVGIWRVIFALVGAM